MKSNLKVLDKFDKKENIYKLIVQYAERAHNIINGAIPDIEKEDTSVINIVMEEHLKKEKEKDK